MLSRAIPAMLAGPLAGVLLDRFDRRKIMIASDLVRARARARLHPGHTLSSTTWLLYLLSALLMFASPFFTSGRSAILPAIATEDELHTANSLTQTTSWTTLAVGASSAGRRWRISAIKWPSSSMPFVLFSAFCIAQSAVGQGSLPGGRPQSQRDESGAAVARIPGRAWLYARLPLILGIGLIAVGWASGGGAAQVLFTLFSEMVFKRGAAGLGSFGGSPASGC